MGDMKITTAAVIMAIAESMEITVKVLPGSIKFALSLIGSICLEHETFTELLRAIFHLTEELEARSGVEKLSDADGEHLAGDIRRAYVILIGEWLGYMKHFKKEYPYLFSLAVRTNPFDERASASFQ